MGMDEERIAGARDGEAGSGIDRARAIRLTKLAGYASVSAALVLIVVKAGAWYATGSVAMLASLVDSLLDSLASVMTLLAVHHAARPPDREHRFGHGKVEGVAGLVQSAIIAGSAVFLLFAAIERLIHPKPVEHGIEGVAVIGFSIVVTAVLVLFQRSVSRRTGSVAIAADSVHYATDLLVNLGVILALVLASRFGLPLADPIISLAIVALILRGAYAIFRDSFNHLMDHEMPEEKRAEILAVVTAHPLAQAVHDLRTRYSGTLPIIQMHLEMDPNMTLSAAHAIADEIEERIRERFPGAEIIIHQDPAGLEWPHSSVARRRAV